MGVPMCPGCRALLAPHEAACHYCGWNAALTEVRRRGGLVERALRPTGGLIPAIVGANIILYAITALAHAAAVRAASTEDPGAAAPFVQGLMNPDAGILVGLGAMVPEFVLGGKEAWRLLCPVFLHGGLFHILLNMMALRNLGAPVEGAYGAGKALALYLLAGIVGNLASLGWFLYAGPVVEDGVQILIPRIGASGAIIGFAGILAGLGFRIGGKPGRALWAPMLKSVGFIFGLGLLLWITDSPFLLDNTAHAGGFLFGMAAGYSCAFGIRARGNARAVRLWDAAAVVLVLLTVAAFVPPAIALARARG